MSKYECPDKIYKYLSFNGSCKTLEDRTFRLSKPSEFNDPFDMYIQEGFGKNKNAFLEDLKGAFLDFFEKGKNLSNLPDSRMKTKIFLIDAALKMASKEHKAFLRKQILRTPIEEMYDLKKLEQTVQEMLFYIYQRSEVEGVFCSTIDFNNLLMWAHYADKHQGTVIEFTPSKGKDSVFLASRKVTYSDERPVLYTTAQEMVLHGFTMSTNKSVKVILDKLIYTKSREWRYEQEYRLSIPSCIKSGQAFATLEYYPEELTSVFLGCRMSQQNQETSIVLAKAVNPLVTIYKASPKPRDFGLIFEKFS